MHLIAFSFEAASDGNLSNLIRIHHALQRRCIAKMIAKFMNNNSLNEIISFYEQKDYRNLFLSAHAFKGVTGNLALTPLFELSSKITEATRNSDGANLDNEIKELKEAYSLIEINYAKYIV